MIKLDLLQLGLVVMTLGMIHLFSQANVMANEVQRELLWPDGAPGTKENSKSYQPAITVYVPSVAENTKTAVIICPGGGYGHLAIGHEGLEIAQWFNSFGVTAVVLEYRMKKGGYQHPIPLLDAQRALRTVRSRSSALNINPKQIGIIGFSAGGHLSATCGTQFDLGDPKAKDPIDTFSSRPDFMILCYPVIAFGESFTHKGSQRNLLGKSATPEMLVSLSAEKQVTKATPPTFLFHTDADTGVLPENSVAFYMALRKAGVPAEIHIYQHGPHGVGLAQHLPETKQWPNACKNWLKGRGLIGAAPR